MTGVETLTLSEAAEAIAAHQLSPLEYLDGLLAWIEKVGPSLDAFICLRIDEARAAARAAGDEIVRDGVR
jgi:aspartyl-tRNA(Asn)/glutamyl-tRNA(Gln) amidotransferase subunit A